MANVNLTNEQVLEQKVVVLKAANDRLVEEVSLQQAINVALTQQVQALSDALAVHEQANEATPEEGQ